MTTLRSLHAFVNGKRVGRLDEVQAADGIAPTYRFAYEGSLSTSDAVSVTMPTTKSEFTTQRIPPIFTQNMPEGPRLASLMKAGKIIRLDDHFGIISATGAIAIGRVRMSPDTTLATELLPSITEKDGRASLLKILEGLGISQGISGAQPKMLSTIPRTLYG
ncbi:MAG: HipA N-terminal domain-containing protein, partial [Betaproteobacteria bacterium]